MPLARRPSRAAPSRSTSSADRTVTLTLTVTDTVPLTLTLPHFLTLPFTHPSPHPVSQVGVAEHVYVCGRQFMQSELATFRACDTAVFILQTTAAARRWPTTTRKLDELRAAFRQTNGARRA